MVPDEYLLVFFWGSSHLFHPAYWPINLCTIKLSWLNQFALLTNMYTGSTSINSRKSPKKLVLHWPGHSWLKHHPVHAKVADRSPVRAAYGRQLINVCLCLSLSHLCAFISTSILNRGNKVLVVYTWSSSQLNNNNTEATIFRSKSLSSKF